ncbi:hypothetical protein GO755_08210 [Spirosoma sp. HMF4905]|uniref:Uncharacterized protein n=1 Tax=Spirosoma arboris TaxID=2682092 RepID=A0A7K1S843_9BACT|nr:hypothetical protein [Spirosoma arboris]MVM30012.1 hypothetical protein [Spirosoma arboris]
MKKAVSIGLFLLLLYHMLSYVLAYVSIWWLAESDLSERLLVYRATDSLIEFQVPMIGQSNDARSIARTTEDGFRYHGHYYDVVSLEIRDDTLFIVGIEFKRKHHSIWQADLLSFLNDHISGAADSHRKANQFLKLLLKEYSPNPRVVFRFLSLSRQEACRIPNAIHRFSSRALPVHSPPPEV